MPYSCFSYLPGGPASIPSRDTAWTAPGHLRRMPTSTACFRYQPQAPLSMPATCFRYPPAGSPRGGNRDAVPLVPPGLRQMPTSGTCFRY